MSSSLPAYGAASGSYAGNAGAHMAQPAQCTFPQPPPKRCYCHPAAFSARFGERHAQLNVAYGESRMCSSD